MPNACPAVTFATRPWRLTGCGPNKGVDWLWCLHGEGLGWGKGSEGGSKESCSSWVGLPVIFFGKWVTPTAPRLLSIRDLQNGGPPLKCVFLPQKPVWVLFFQRRQTKPENPCALHQWDGGVLERPTFDLELVHKTGKLFNATHLRVSVDGRNNTGLLWNRLFNSSET